MNGDGLGKRSMERASPLTSIYKFLDLLMEITMETFFLFALGLNIAFLSSVRKHLSLSNENVFACVCVCVCVCVIFVKLFINKNAKKGARFLYF